MTFAILRSLESLKSSRVLTRCKAVYRFTRPTAPNIKI
jgi:hypothetical protein